MEREFLKGTESRLVSLIRFLLQNHEAVLSVPQHPWVKANYGWLLRLQTCSFIKCHRPVSRDVSFSQLYITDERRKGTRKRQLFHDMGDQQWEPMPVLQKAPLSSHREIISCAGNLHARSCLFYNNMLSLWMSSCTSINLTVAGRGLFTIRKPQHFFF